jgi:membrane-associated phospholipid phosphatase
VLAPAISPAGAVIERANLLEAIEFRPNVLTEALAQKDSFIAYFRGALSFSKATHPSTFFLVHAAVRIAEFVAMFYKNMYQRPRPSQLWPELMPPIEVPGHASFPSSHATQAATVALVLQAVVVSPLAGTVVVVPSAADITTRLAQRIARNREVRGLHYPSDSAAGRDILAPAIWATMQTCPTINGLITAAQAEWQAFTT